MSRLTDPNWLITMAIIFLTSMPIHEFAHAWAAFQLGDDTAARLGRLTVNPLAHLDPIGTIMLVLAGFGWGKPVPVAPYRLRAPMRRSWALVSVAGPMSNFLLALLAAIPFRLGLLEPYWTESLSVNNVLLQFVFINLGLMVFNLIPIPPLDGSRILGWVLPGKWADSLDRLERYARPALMLVLFGLSRVGVLGLLMGPINRFLASALLGY